MSVVSSKVAESQLHADGEDVAIFSHAFRLIKPYLHDLRGHEELGKSASFRDLQSRSFLNSALSEVSKLRTFPVLDQVFKQRDIVDTHLRVWLTRGGCWLVWLGRFKTVEQVSNVDVFAGDTAPSEAFEVFESVETLCEYLSQQVQDESYIRGETSHTRPRFLPLILSNNLSLLLGETINEHQTKLNRMKEAQADATARVAAVDYGV